MLIIVTKRAYLCGFFIDVLRGMLNFISYKQIIDIVRGVARRGPGVPVTHLGRPSFEQTTYNIQVAKTP